MDEKIVHKKKQSGSHSKPIGVHPEIDNVRPVVLLPNEDFTEFICSPHIFLVSKIDKLPSTNGWGHYYESENCRHCGKTIYECYNFMKVSAWYCVSVGMIGDQYFAYNSRLRLISKEEFDNFKGDGNNTSHGLESNKIEISIGKIDHSYRHRFKLYVSYDEKMNVRDYTIHALNEGPYIVAAKEIQALKETNDRDITSTLIQYLQEHDESDLVSQFKKLGIKFDNHHAIYEMWD